MSHLTGFTDPSAAALPLHVLDREGFASWCADQPTQVLAWAQAQRFDAAPGSVLLLPGEQGLAGAVLGIGTALTRMRMRMHRWRCRRPAGGCWPRR